MAHWKYHLEAGDEVKVQYQGDVGWATITGVGCREGADLPMEDGRVVIESFDEVALEDLIVEVSSGTKDGIVVPMPDVLEKGRDSEGRDIPLLGESMRLGDTL